MNRLSEIDIVEFTEDCSTLQEIFGKACKEGIHLQVMGLRCSQKVHELKVIQNKADFALVEVFAIEAGNSLVPCFDIGPLIHPYGSSVVYVPVHS